MTPEERTKDMQRKRAMFFRNLANFAIWDAQDYRDQGKDALMRSRVVAARRLNHRSLQYRRGELTR